MELKEERWFELSAKMEGKIRNQLQHCSLNIITFRLDPQQN
jgi:hypothetical protein